MIFDIYNNKKFIKELFKIINYNLLAPWINLQRHELKDNYRIAAGADAWITIPNVNLGIIKEIIIPSYLELQSFVGNIYLSLLGGVRYLKHPIEYLI